jgi:hypothetical protein
MAKKEVFEYQYRYLGDAKDIDIDTLITSQVHFAAMVKEVQNRYFPDSKISIRINGFSPDSFGVNEQMIIEQVTTLFTKENIVLASVVVGIVADFIAIKKAVKGDKEAKIEEKKIDNNRTEINITIQDSPGTKLKVYTNAMDLYKNSDEMDRASKKNIAAIDKDENIDGIELNDVENKKNILQANKDEFKYILADSIYSKKEDKDKDEEVDLLVKKPDLSPKNSNNVHWDFIYKGRKITAQIEDESFIKKVLDGQKFGRGDSLRANVKIHYKLDSSLGTYLESKFTVTRIIKINERLLGGDQLSIPD